MKRTTNNYAQTDPYRMLIAAIVVQAVTDYKRKSDPLGQLSASLFLLRDGAHYCTVAGWNVDQERLEVLVGNLT